MKKITFEIWQNTRMFLTWQQNQYKIRNVLPWIDSIKEYNNTCKGIYLYDDDSFIFLIDQFYSSEKKQDIKVYHLICHNFDEISTDLNKLEKRLWKHHSKSNYKNNTLYKTT